MSWIGITFCALTLRCGPRRKGSAVRLALYGAQVALVYPARVRKRPSRRLDVVKWASVVCATFGSCFCMAKTMGIFPNSANALVPDHSGSIFQFLVPVPQCSWKCIFPNSAKSITPRPFWEHFPVPVQSNLHKLPQTRKFAFEMDLRIILKNPKVQLRRRIYVCSVTFA